MRGTREGVGREMFLTMENSKWINLRSKNSDNRHNWIPLSIQTNLFNFNIIKDTLFNTYNISLRINILDPHMQRN